MNKSNNGLDILKKIIISEIISKNSQAVLKKDHAFIPKNMITINQHNKHVKVLFATIEYNYKNDIIIKQYYDRNFAVSRFLYDDPVKIDGYKETKTENISELYDKVFN